MMKVKSMSRKSLSGGFVRRSRLDSCALGKKRILVRRRLVTEKGKGTAHQVLFIWRWEQATALDSGLRWNDGNGNGCSRNDGI
jgi:hypothetical protein